MAFLDQSFSLDELPQSTSNSFEPLPIGAYTATITKAEVKITKLGDGEYISLRFDITGPTHQGRVVFHNLNIKNKNPKSEAMALADLGKIMRATGLSRVTDTDQLIGGNMTIKLTIKQDEKYGAGNNVVDILSSGSSPAPMPSTSAPAPAGAASKASPPWGKK